uniref:Uncharacterized protein n=1 Tax=Streptomyces sp. NBC_00049 TaxID=2903617 RepID=A0AAU2JWC8_9ACTN
MIGEPELDGAWEQAQPAGTAREDAAYEEASARGPGRTPWRWVLVTALVTSALWAGGLRAFGDRLTEPEVAYRITDNLCAQMKASAIAGLLGPLPDSDTSQSEVRHEAMDRAVCSRSGAHPDSGPAEAGAYYVQARVELHKKTDPAAEFALRTMYDRTDGDDVDPWETVPGLGEQALVTGPEDEDQEQDHIVLRVRDGGAVFTLGVVFLDLSTGEGGEEGVGAAERAPRPRPRPDRETLKAALIEDMRTLMDALHED